MRKDSAQRRAGSLALRPAVWGGHRNQGSGVSESGSCRTITVMTACGWQIVFGRWLQPYLSSYLLFCNADFATPLPRGRVGSLLLNLG